MRSEPYFLHLAAAAVDTNHDGIGRNVWRKTGREAFHIARDTMTIGTKQTGDLGALRILAQSIVDFLQPLLRRIVCEDAQLLGEQNIVL